MINLAEFTAYLQEQRLKPRTISEHLLNVERFMNWAMQENYHDISTVRYNDLLTYIQQQKATGIAVATTNLRLASIRHYFEHLKQAGAVAKNPAKTIRVKGSIKTVIKNPLNKIELEALYQQYSQLPKVTRFQHQTDINHLRNTVVLGLLVFQGVHSGELQKMEVSHINLNAGTAYIPSTSQGNNRILELSQKQVIALHQYLTAIRGHLKPKRDELIPGSLRNIILRLMEEIKGINPVVTNALHIRGSVILNWLKSHNKRQVQYMAGHKYISSTEKYASQEVEDLGDALARYHPFG
jgi:site-specific recombinase XerD